MYSNANLHRLDARLQQPFTGQLPILEMNTAAQSLMARTTVSGLLLREPALTVVITSDALQTWLRSADLVHLELFGVTEVLVDAPPPLVATAIRMEMSLSLPASAFSSSFLAATTAARCLSTSS